MRRVSENPPARSPDRPIDRAEYPWFVAHVKPRQEKALADDCLRLGIEYYLPMTVKVTRRKDNNKPRKSVLPLFAGYLSFSSAREAHAGLYATGHVAGIIEIRHQKKFIAELGQIYSLLEKGVPLEPCTMALAEGDEVYIEAGPLRGVRGVITTVRDRERLILAVEGLGRAIATIDAAMVKPITERKPLTPC
jgi:transcription antitermination factor NusG